MIRLEGHDGDGDVVYLPNAHGPAVEQHPIAVEGSAWWQRAEDGVLWVRCLWWEDAKTKSGRSYGRVWSPRPAPIPGWDDPPPSPLYPHLKPEPLPDRSPNVDRITCALDLRGLYGPEVDEALGVATPNDEVVDAWEAGTIIPTHDEIRRLAVLTGMLPAWFYAGTLPAMSHVFICPGGFYGESLDDEERCPTCGQEVHDDQVAEQLPLDLGDG